MSVDLDIVVSRLDLMARLLADLDSAGKVTKARLEGERLLLHAVERILGQLVDLAVSINSHLIAASRGTAPTTYRKSFVAEAAARIAAGTSTRTAPTTYRQSFVDLAGMGVLPAELAGRLALTAGLRNILTHEYVPIDLGMWRPQYRRPNGTSPNTSGRSRRTLRTDRGIRRDYLLGRCRPCGADSAQAAPARRPRRHAVRPGGGCLRK